MNGLKRIWIVARKEFIDNLRDRRSVSSSLLTSVTTPLMIIAMIVVLGNTLLKDSTETPLTLPVQGAEYAPGLIEYLEQRNVIITEAPADPEHAVREGDLAIVLVISPEYGEAFQKGEPAPVQLVMDSSRQSTMIEVERAREIVNGYSQTLAILRLQARGISPSILEPLEVQRRDVSTPQSSAIIFLNMLPFVLVMTIFVGGMYVIIDTTAGERERGSFEPLLINPVPRREFVLGKLAASLPYSLASLVVALAVLWLGFNILPLEEYTGMQMTISADVIFRIFWLSLPIVLLASVLQMVVAAFTRSFKEAQTYLSFLPLVAGMPVMFLAFISVKPSVGVSLIPIFSQSLIVNQLLRGETISQVNVIVSAIATLVAAAAFIVVAIRLYEREKILFGGR
ncbi:MAG: ABC transporter permease [Chloroflexi bacterium]|nr:ABC transporter permease [Chloroflexota bacterium]